jgi:hypothetical protein
MAAPPQASIARPSGPAGTVIEMGWTGSKGRGRGGEGPLPGRLVLLFGAYAPVAIIIAARAIPCTAGWVALGVGVAGVICWSAFLIWLRSHQPRSAEVTEIEPIDDEVTGYIVSILLPLVVAGDPGAGDLVAYGICAVLILLVAYVSDLAVANPLIYLLGYRVARANIGGERTIVLVDDLNTPEGSVTVRRAVGVTYIPSL